MMRYMIIGCVIVAAMAQSLSAQNISRASQVVTFSVRTTNHSVIAGTNDRTLPSDVKVTAAVNTQISDGTSRAMDLRSVSSRSGIAYSAPSGANDKSSEVVSIEGSGQQAGHAVLLTVTQ